MRSSREKKCKKGFGPKTPLLILIQCLDNAIKRLQAHSGEETLLDVRGRDRVAGPHSSNWLGSLKKGRHGDVKPPCCCPQAAMGGSADLETSATVFDTLSGLSFRAKSAWATIPITRSSASTIGMRLI